MGQDGYLIPLPQIANTLPASDPSLPQPHSTHCQCQVTKCQHLCHFGLRKSPGACCNANHSGDARSPLLSQAFKREYITGRGKSAVSSAFRLCLNDKMEEELGSIWTVLIVAGLSAVLQARRFSSSAGEEKHICHNSLGLLSAVRGVWIETLGWWGHVVRWLLPFLAPWHTSEDYRQKKKSQHCIATCLGGA